MFPDNPIYRAIAALGYVLLGVIIAVLASRVARLRALLRQHLPYKKGRYEPKMTTAGAVMFLESAGKIKLHLSTADNALAILQSVLPEDMTESVRASVLYAIDVLKSDLSQSTLPVGLTLKFGEGLSNKSHPASEILVREWLLLNYTPKRTRRNHRKVTFKSVARAVSFCIGLRHEVQARDMYVFDVEPSEMEIINRALEGSDEWDWDIWNLEEASKGRPLQTLGWHLLHKWDLVNTLKLDRCTVRNWLCFVEKLYQDNDYHNSTHAADVLQASHFLLDRGKASEFLSPLMVFAVLMTAIIHDAGHDGRNNLYHQNVTSDRALTFNDQSVQENFHCTIVFSSMSKDDTINILGTMDASQAKEVRRLVIHMILATDMKSHFTQFQEFKSLVNRKGPYRDQWKNDPVALDSLCANLVHAADLSNPCRNFALADEWASSVLEEFFAQGDAEKLQNLPVSPLCSRDTTLKPASQIGFINFVVKPYFQVWGDFLPEVQRRLLPQLDANLSEWESKAAETEPSPDAPEPPEPPPTSFMLRRRSSVSRPTPY